jgi:heme/copper-type cytochrome/quinol oxidase subunit 4
LKKWIAYFCHGQSEISQYWVKFSISFIATDISFLELKYSVVSSANCEVFILCVCSSIFICKVLRFLLWSWLHRMWKT